MLSASRDVIISSQFAARIRREIFTLGDGCWLPIVVLKTRHESSEELRGVVQFALKFALKDAAPAVCSSRFAETTAKAGKTEQNAPPILDPHPQKFTKFGLLSVFLGKFRRKARKCRNLVNPLLLSLGDKRAVS